MIKVGKWLRCGCCGGSFQIWEGYVDQDQDDGYGVCESCQADIKAKDTAEMDRAIKALKDGLNETNAAIFEEMDRELQQAMVFQALEDGILTMEFRNSH